MKKLIAYCGLDCEKCDAQIATLNNDDALREKVAKLWFLFFTGEENFNFIRL